MSTETYPNFIEEINNANVVASTEPVVPMPTQALIVLSDDTFTPRRSTGSDVIEYSSLIHTKKTTIIHNHPFIQYKKVDYHSSWRLYDYGNNVETLKHTWRSTGIADFWGLVAKINWCYGDIDFSDYKFESVTLALRRMSIRDMINLCTGFYYSTMALWNVLKPLFKEYNYTPSECKIATAHITMLGKNWYQQIMEDPDFARVILDDKKIADFKPYLDKALTYTWSTYIIDLNDA